MPNELMKTLTVGANTYDLPQKTSDLTNDSGFIAAPSANVDEVIAYNGTTWVADKRMVILSYGSSTWTDFINAYNSNAVVYCRASSNANPASGSQTRLAFMAYVNNATTPTNVEFQYYRSVSTHTASQQGDQVFVYKLDKTSGWSVTTREASVKVVAGDGLGGTYSNGTMTLAVSGAIPSDVTATTQTSTDNSTKIATTAFVKTAIDNADLWKQGADANDQPVAGAIKAKDYVDTDNVSRTNSAPWTGDFVAGGDNTATGNYAVIAGRGNTANAYSTTIGDSNTAAGGGGSTLLGNSNQATSGTWGFATGYGNTISHNNTVAMGWQNTASNYNAVAMGRDNIASGNSSSAIGYGNTASETAAHAEGRNTTASGKGAHSEGYVTEASGCQSHAEGQGTQATARYNHVFGTYNISDPGFTAATERGTYIEIVGNGTDAQNLSNARTLDWSGNEWVAGLVSVGSSSTPPTPTANNHLTTKKYVDDIVGNIETLLASI